MMAGCPAAYAVQPDEIMSDPAKEARARDLSRELRCMVCQNQSIDDSDAPLARDLRLLVRERIAAGDSDSQVIDFLVARYGEFVLLKPRFTPHTLLLWLLPPLALVGGGLALWFYSRRRANAGAADDPVAAALDGRGRGAAGAPARGRCAGQAGLEPAIASGRVSAMTPLFKNKHRPGGNRTWPFHSTTPAWRIICRSSAPSAASSSAASTHFREKNIDPGNDRRGAAGAGHAAAAFPDHLRRAAFPRRHRGRAERRISSALVQDAVRLRRIAGAGRADPRGAGGAGRRTPSMRSAAATSSFSSAITNCPSRRRAS